MPNSGPPTLPFESSQQQRSSTGYPATPTTRGAGTAASPMTLVGERPRGGTNGGGLVTTEMQGIAKRIEDRCLEREKERHALAAAQAERATVEDELQGLRESHQEARIAFLEGLRTAQGAELELHHWQVERRRHSHEQRQRDEQDARDQDRLDEALASWHDELSVMASAVVKRESYLVRLRGMIDAKRSADNKRLRKKVLLRQHNESLEARAIEAMRDTDRAKDEIMRLEEEDLARKVRVQDVADQVRSQLDKRAKLRRAHLEAQHLLRTANPFA